MTTQDFDMDALGAEALPGGLAEIQRALQFAPAIEDTVTPERRAACRAGLADRRRPLSKPAR